MTKFRPNSQLDRDYPRKVTLRYLPFLLKDKFKKYYSAKMTNN